MNQRPQKLVRTADGRDEAGRILAYAWLEDNSGRVVLNSVRKGDNTMTLNLQSYFDDLIARVK